MIAYLLSEIAGDGVFIPLIVSAPKKEKTKIPIPPDVPTGRPPLSIPTIGLTRTQALKEKACGEVLLNV